MEEKTPEATCEEPAGKGGPQKGLVHIYTGEGKGKTIASVGLAVRAAGWGLRVLFVQFFKPEGDPSGEKEIFRKNVPSVELMRSNSRHPCFTGKKTDIAAVKKDALKMFQSVKARAKEGFDLVILDEAIGAINGGFIELGDMVDFIEGRPQNLEVVLTGRDAPVEIVKVADYVTEMLKIKHPYDRGIKARRGIDF